MENDSHPLDFYPEEETGDELTDSLALIDKARAALAQAETLPDIGAVMMVAEQARHYAQKAKLGRAAENHAARIRIEAERKAGALLAVMDRQRRGRPDKSEDLADLPTPKLADLGVTHRQASDWQRIARVPDEVFDAHVKEVQRAGDALTTSGVVQVARQIERDQRRAAPKPEPDLTAVPSSVRCEVANALVLPLDRETVDLIVTSPPYGLDIDYEDGDVSPAAWEAFMYRWLLEARRVTKPSGRLALNVPLDTTRGGCRPSYAQAVAAAIRAGWAYRSTVVWHDGQTTKGGWALGSQSSAARPHHVSQVEMIALFSFGEWAPSSDNPDDITPDQFLEAGRGPWAFPGETRAWESHPAPFPIELPRRLIRYLCRVGDVVLDPFCGSGTTLLAAHQLGRQAIGFDRSRAYVDSTLRRLAADRGRSDTVHAVGVSEGLRGEGAPEGESGGLRSGIHRGTGSAGEPVVFQGGASGVAV